MKYEVPSGYQIVELNKRVPNVNAELFRWKWKAKRRCRKLESQRIVNYYRFEVRQVSGLNGHWVVVAMQNQIEQRKSPPKPND